MTPRSGPRAAAPLDTLEENLSIETAEQVTLSLPIAGLFNRSVASLLDHMIMGTLVVVLILVNMVVPLLDTLGEILATIIGASFYGAYFLGCEFYMQGQTPGKRAMRLRVVDHLGQPATPTQILIRNLIRPADVLLTLLGIELFFLFWSPRNLRLGDLAAGTLVIREIPTRFEDIRETLERHQFFQAHGATNPEGGATARRLTREERDLVTRFFERASALNQTQREELATRILQRLEARLGGLSANEGLPAFERLRLHWQTVQQETPR